MISTIFISCKNDDIGTNIKEYDIGEVSYKDEQPIYVSSPIKDHPVFMDMKWGASPEEILEIINIVDNNKTFISGISSDKSSVIYTIEDDKLYGSDVIINAHFGLEDNYNRGLNNIELITANKQIASEIISDMNKIFESYGLSISLDDLSGSINQLTLGSESTYKYFDKDMYTKFNESYDNMLAPLLSSEYDEKSIDYMKLNMLKYYLVTGSISKITIDNEEQYWFSIKSEIPLVNIS